MTAQHKTKQIWIECDRVAKILDVKKTEVYQYLYPEFKDSVWKSLLENNVDVVLHVKNSPEFGRLMKARNPDIKVHQPEESEERGLGKPKTRDQKLKLAMWFISRFDSPDDALHVMKAAVQACHSLDEPTRPVRGD